MTPPLWLALLAMEVPPIMALLDAVQRPDDHYPGGPDDKRAWRNWLIVAVVTAPIVLGFLIVTGYYMVIVQRNQSRSPRS